MAQVKRNQPNLFDAIQQIKLEQLPIDNYQHTERKRGVTTTWFVHVYEAHIGHLHQQWANLNRIIQVHKTVESTEKTTHSERFYISDLSKDSASFFHEGIRGHWGIENNLHRTKDVFHNEDANGIKKGNGPINMSIISSMVINIHRFNGEYSMPDAQIKFCCHLERAVEQYQFW